jgi:hypothetical protein
VDTLQDVTVAEIVSASTGASETSTVHTPFHSGKPNMDNKVCNHCYILLHCYLFSGRSLSVYKYTDEKSVMLHGNEKRKRGRGKKTVASENEAADKAIEQMKVHEEEPTMSGPVNDEQDTPKPAWMVTIMDTNAVQRDMENPGFLNTLLYPLMTDVYQVCCMLGIITLLFGIHLLHYDGAFIIRCLQCYWIHWKACSKLELLEYYITSIVILVYSS